MRTVQYRSQIIFLKKEGFFYILSYISNKCRKLSLKANEEEYQM